MVRTLCWRSASRLRSWRSLAWGAAGAAGGDEAGTGAGAARPLFRFASAPPSDTGPAIPAKPALRSAYGHTWEDEYSWLEEPSPAVEAVLQQEGEYFERWMRGTQRAQRELLDAMLCLLPEEQVTPPERVGPYAYYVRQLPDRPHPCYMRRRVPAATGGEAGPEEVLVDVNELAAVHGRGVTVRQVKLSRCNQRLAFTLESGDGSEQCAGFMRDLPSRQLLQHPALDSVVSLEWAGDGRTLLYTTPNQLGRPWRVLRCAANAADSVCSSSSPQLVFEEPDERYFVELSRTKDWAFLAINANSKTSSEVRLIPAADPAAPPALVCPRQEGLEYFVEHHSGRLLLLSNARGAANYALFSAPVPAPGAAAPSGPDSWQLLVPEREGVALEDLDVFEAGAVLYERRQGRPAVSVLPLGAGSGPWGEEGGGAGAEEGAMARLQQVPLPDWALSVSPGANADFFSPTLRLSLSSPVHPEAVYDCHLPSRQLALLQAPAANSHDPSRYSCSTQWVPSADGTAVPLTLVHATGLERDGSAPCLVVVYGAYGTCLPTDFYPERVPLLERGWVLALAHVRGGGELGRRWHAAGRGEHKERSIEDLEACADWLVQSGLTSHPHIALEALSAGGLTAGALLARRPSAVGAALLEAPFVDVLTAMCDPSLPLTLHEHEEWGDPSAGPAAFQRLRRLCPYQSLHPAAYPPTLLTCSQSDGRVPFWGPLKFAARLRGAQRGAAPVLLLPDAHEGHFAAEAERLRLKALHYAFLLKALGAGGGGGDCGKGG